MNIWKIWALILLLLVLLFTLQNSPKSDAPLTFLVQDGAGMTHVVTYDPGMGLLDDRVDGVLVYADVFEDGIQAEEARRRMEAYLESLQE